jgi:phosphinothricin acetyltransferase
MTEAANIASPTIRRAKTEDASRIAEIHNQSIAANDSTMQEDPASDGAVRDLILDNGSQAAVLVIEAHGVVVGWGRIWPYSQRFGYRFAAETAVFIDRSLRRRGLGTLLQSALVDEGAKLGYHHLVAKIFADNTASVDMHLKLGYDLVGVQREIGFKNGAWKDVAILQYVFD